MAKIKNLSKTKCPNCGQYKLMSIRLVLILSGVVLLIFGLPLIFVIIGIPMVLAGVLALVLAIFMGGYRCRNCNWTAKKPPDVEKI